MLFVVVLALGGCTPAARSQAAASPKSSDTEPAHEPTPVTYPITERPKQPERPKCEPVPDAAASVDFAQLENHPGLTGQWNIVSHHLVCTPERLPGLSLAKLAIRRDGQKTRLVTPVGSFTEESRSYQLEPQREPGKQILIGRPQWIGLNRSVLRSLGPLVSGAVFEASYCDSIPDFEGIPASDDQCLVFVDAGRVPVLVMTLKPGPPRDEHCRASIPPGTGTIRHAQRVPLGTYVVDRITAGCDPAQLLPERVTVRVEADRWQLSAGSARWSQPSDERELQPVKGTPGEEDFRAVAAVSQTLVRHPMMPGVLADVFGRQRGRCWALGTALQLRPEGVSSCTDGSANAEWDSNGKLRKR